MKGNKKWIQVLALAMSLPSTIFVLAILAFKSVEHGVLTKPWAFGIFFAVITQIFFLMVWYAVKSKNKP